MRQSWTDSELINLTGISARHIRKIAARENLSYEEIPVRGGKKKRFLLSGMPEHRQAAILGKLNVDNLPIIRETDDRLWRRRAVPISKAIIEKTPATNQQQQIALARADLVRFYEKHLEEHGLWGGKKQAKNRFMKAYNSGELFPHLFAILGPVTWQTIERWKKSLRKHGDALKLAPKRGFARRGQTILSEEQTQILIRCALSPNKPKIAEAIRTARALMEITGVPDGASDDTYRRALKRWIEEHYHIWVFNREGAKGWNDRVAFYIERDYGVLNVGDVLVADGHYLNCEILNPWTGKPKRMVLILFYDMKSNMPLGWEILPTENTQGIASALRRAILRLGKIPKVVYLDNGKAFRARFFQGVDLEQSGFEGLFARLGIKTIFAWPYHGQSKTVERFFGSFAELERLSPTYVGTSIEHQPPRLKRGERLHRKVYEKATGGKCLTLEQMHRAAAAWFDMYAQRPQKGHLEGRCPQEVFDEQRGPGVDPGQLRFLMMSQEVRTIRRNGITFLGTNYYHPELYGRRHPVVIRFDYQDPSELIVYELHGAADGEPLCIARPVEKVHPAANILGTEADQARLKEQIRLKRSQEREASRSARDILENEVMPEHARRLEQLGINTTELAPIIGKMDDRLQRRRGKKQRIVEIREVSAGEIEEARPTPEEEDARIQAELEELIELQKGLPPEPQAEEYVPEVWDETAAMWDKIRKMPEMDRYEKLVELDVRGMLIPRQDRAFMCYFEETKTYARHIEYFEEFRTKTAMMYQVEG